MVQLVDTKCISCLSDLAFDQLQLHLSQLLELALSNKLWNEIECRSLMLQWSFIKSGISPIFRFFLFSLLLEIDKDLQWMGGEMVAWPWNKKYPPKRSSIAITHQDCWLSRKGSFYCQGSKFIGMILSLIADREGLVADWEMALMGRDASMLPAMLIWQGWFTRSLLNFVEIRKKNILHTAPGP